MHVHVYTGMHIAKYMYMCLAYLCLPFTSVWVMYMYLYTYMYYIVFTCTCTCICYDHICDVMWNALHHHLRITVTRELHSTTFEMNSSHHIKKEESPTSPWALRINLVFSLVRLCIQYMCTCTVYIHCTLSVHIVRSGRQSLADVLSSSNSMRHLAKQITLYMYMFM